MGRPRTPLLSRELIREKALELIDTGGLSALSMRKLASELGVQAASLYTHYPTKEALLDGISESIMGQVDASGFQTQDWAEALMAWARSYRAALAAHPNFVPFIAAGPSRWEPALRAADAVHGGLIAAGWPPRHATMIGASTKYLVLGAAMVSFTSGFAPDEQAYADRFPNLNQAHLLQAHAEKIDAGSFEFALRSFVDGLRAQYTQL